MEFNKKKKREPFLRMIPVSIPNCFGNRLPLFWRNADLHFACALLVSVFRIASKPSAIIQPAWKSCSIAFVCSGPKPEFQFDSLTGANLLKATLLTLCFSSASSESQVGIFLFRTSRNFNLLLFQGIGLSNTALQQSASVFQRTLRLSPLPFISQRHIKSRLP